MGETKEQIKISVDEYDRAIINLLMRDGRSAIAEIARQVSGLTERAIDYRINRLIENSVITINPIFNPIALGYPIQADIFIDIKAGKIPSVTDRLISLDRVSFLALTFGRHDISLTVHARDNHDLQEYLQANLATISEVTDTNTILIARTLKDPTDWTLPAPGGEFTPPKQLIDHQLSQQDVIEISDLDRIIFDCLRSNSRLPITEMVRRIADTGINVSANKVSNHLTDLIANRTLRVSAIVNPDVIGYPIRSDVLISVEGKFMQEVAEKLVLMQETSYVATTIDGNKISIQVYMPTMTELYDLILNKVQELPGVVKTETTLIRSVLIGMCLGSA